MKTILVSFGTFLSGIVLSIGFLLTPYSPYVLLDKGELITFVQEHMLLFQIAQACLKGGTGI